MNIIVFFKNEVLVRGARDEVIARMREMQPVARASDLLAFDEDTGKQIDIDLRDIPEAPPTRGRPKLGVKAKEITLLPRHWDWLARQGGGASAVLRKLVDAEIAKGRTDREAKNAAYNFLTVMAGDLPGFEEAIRQMYAGNQDGFAKAASEWPPAIREHGQQMAFPA